jgi:hypothetical protein
MIIFGFGWSNTGCDSIIETILNVGSLIYSFDTRIPWSALSLVAPSFGDFHLIKVIEENELFKYDKASFKNNVDAISISSSYLFSM